MNLQEIDSSATIDFKIHPTPENLQNIVGSSLIFEDILVLNKAIRMWYILCLVHENSGDKYRLTRKEWQDRLSDCDRQTSQSLRETGNIRERMIPELLFLQDRTKLWDKWKMQFVEFQHIYGIKEMRGEKGRKYELAPDGLKAFSVTPKTIQNTFKSLVDRNILRLVNCDYKHYKEQPLRCDGTCECIDLTDWTISQDKSIKLPSISDLGDSLKDSEATTNFSSYINLFAEPIQGISRFYIYSDYQQLDLDRNKIKNIQDKLLSIWQEEKTVPVKLGYKSAIKGKYDAIVYPLVVHYYQRGFYLYAYGKIDGSDESCRWHNYRIDRIETIDILSWESDNICQDIRDRCYEQDDQELIFDEIEDKMNEAYGFDFHLKTGEMLLRFDRDFHDRYIKNTWRHNTFEPIKGEELEIFVEQKKNKDEISPVVAKRVNSFDRDAYYKMKYRIDDNTVIMRLRAWGQNVEVIYPPALRDRMRSDIQENWNLYSQD
jgi:CRISPR-associated protein (TIGR03985 family)